jgi:hypothetical protein
MLNLSRVLVAVASAVVVFAVKPVYAEGTAPAVGDLMYYTQIAKDGTTGNLVATGGVTDVDNDFRKLEVELDASGTWNLVDGDNMRWIYYSPQLPLGKHSFRLRATDYAGNSSLTGPYNFELFKCAEYTSNNVVHVSAGRATLSGLTAYAKGSGDKMGYYSLFITTKLAETKSGYYIVGSCPK